MHLGTAFLAYTLELRHVVDADHIAAIDNVIRKLMHEGKQPVLLGTNRRFMSLPVASSMNTNNAQGSPRFSNQRCSLPSIWTSSP